MLKITTVVLWLPLTDYQAMELSATFIILTTSLDIR